MTMAKVTDLLVEDSEPRLLHPDDEKRVAGAAMDIHEFNPDLAEPDGLNEKGREAWQVIVAFLKRHDMTFTGGCKAFYSPEDWKARGESYGLKSKLIICHDGGMLYEIFNLDAENYGLNEQMNQALEAVGLYYESCTTWYSAVYER